MDKIKLSNNKIRKIDKNVKVLRNPHTGRMVKSTSKLGKQILSEQSKFNQSGGGSHIKRDDIPKLKCVVYINDVLEEVGLLDLGSESTPELSNETLNNFTLAGIFTTEEEKQEAMNALIIPNAQKVTYTSNEEIEDIKVIIKLFRYG